MMRRLNISFKGSGSWLPVVSMVALWIPAMIAASPVWANGDYYEYGWFVPVAALWLIIRRWKTLEKPRTLSRPWRMAAVAALLLPWFLMLRVLGYADPSWRLPMILLGLTAAVGSHWLIAALHGYRVSKEFLWITLLGFSALPWPTVIESGMVRHLTQGVVGAVAEVFQLCGKPVEVVGDRLRLYGITVEVTDGCSGVRSFQSFVMATWFFAEMQWLRVERTMVLLVCACGTAFLVNMARTYVLAWIRFVQGETAFQQAHDHLGLLAFLVSGVFFYILSDRLSPKRLQILVKTLQSR